MSLIVIFTADSPIPNTQELVDKICTLEGAEDGVLLLPREWQLYIASFAALA